MLKRPRAIALIVIGIVVSVALVVIVTAALTPGETHPAFAAAVAFVEATAHGDDAAATALMTPELAAYIARNCPEGSVSACVQGYTPPEWGEMLSAVFRRAAPDGPDWNVDVIATYEHGQGFSGVCIYTRLTAEGEAWKVAEYAGFAACSDAGTRNMATNPDAPNRAPSAP